MQDKRVKKISDYFFEIIIHRTGDTNHSIFYFFKLKYDIDTHYRDYRAIFSCRFTIIEELEKRGFISVYNKI